MKIESHDFRKPSRLASELEQQLVAWLRGGCSLVAEKWAKHMGVAVEHVFEGNDAARPDSALAELPDTALAYCVTVGAEAMNTMLIFPRPLLLTLVAGMLGDSCTQIASDRGMTPVEESLAEYLLQHLLQAVQESWPTNVPVAVRLKNAESTPKRTRLFGAAENLVLCRFAMRGPFGEQPWYWLIPQEGLIELLSRQSDGLEISREQGARTRLESLVREMPVEVSVRLGAAVLRVSQLAGLRAGDLVILDQPVSGPLTAAVAGETRFRVWPGRVGSKQAVQIESLVES